jgi:uncharacterized membrane protein YidH (DUF202 family)
METDEQPKLDNGAGGGRATKTGKPERVGESGDEPINLILGEIQVLLAEKRTALSSLRTGIAIFALPLSVLSVLIATSRYYSFEKVMPLLVPLLVLNLGLVVLGSWLIYHSIHRLHRYDRLIRELTQKNREIADFVD